MQRQAKAIFLGLSKRCYSTQGATPKPVQLAFDKFSLKPSNAAPVLICHGLFGSKQNWSSLAKAMSNRLSRDVYTLDLRNHGDSPHTPEHNYPAMVSDLKEFIKQHDLKDPILLGHSMGGKAVMATALDSPELVSKLIVVDMPPVILKLSNNFSTYIKGMKAIEDADVKKQSEADKILSEYESNVGVRMFLLTNLKKIDGKYRFRIPYQTLGESLESVGHFSFPNNAQFDHPTLFIAGGASPYKPPFLDKQKKKEIDALFPNNELKIVDGAGHWVHAEKPDVVLNMISSFVNESIPKK